MKRIYLSPPHLGEQEIHKVNEVFKSNWIAPLGPEVDGFEQDLQELFDGSYVAVLSSGTAAIHLALILCGTKPGDEVICQSLTFSGSAYPITYTGAHPIFIDSEDNTWNIDPEYLEIAIKNRLKKGKKPKAIIPVHLYGMPASMSKIIEISKLYSIPIIEDAAEALGSKYFDKKCGSIGDYGILSFNGNKIITTSGGGALISSDISVINRAKFLATQARDPAPHYEHSQIGFNYRMSNVIAAIGRGQLKLLEDRIQSRRANFDRYKAYFDAKNKLGYCIKWLDEKKGFFSNRWLTTILIEPKKNNGISREKLWLAFEEKNIESRPVWKPMHMQPVFKDALYFGETVAESIFNHGLCLPSGTNMTEEDWERIFDVLDSIFK
ncbi:pyridoxal phosphate-dependent aminotransferase [Thermaurantimonas aggregans]|uniref:Pyridoxal phosphate-dependent aminotransferase n=1 Tax=Thermaurantimonas aggregans TaxID=2173829 RepID=A0A401XK11_9FLAO|nr:aminotransferase class I/II-fold pyridoxal phosphate-dependent enzyme [Thermaurantimonas aggregans]MCX8148607.1 aminotransferase class I/II-fold pyridoxal phosphate-dependent enzyme [Thermaurantimonas aggregans]GCD77324.1 pyridoxal phosphate-dependent aminotransferase [Thermaurantimonas aggregans]